MFLILGTHKTLVGISYLKGRNMLKDATVFLFLYDALGFSGNIVLDPACIEQFLFVLTTKENLKFLLKAVSFLVLLSGDAGGGSYMGTGLCQVRKPTIFTGRKTSTLFFFQKGGLAIFLLVRKSQICKFVGSFRNCKSAKILRCARLKNRKSANL
jgi:hypothetical protein